MTRTTEQSANSEGVPSPIPALSRFHRVPEAGTDTRQYIGLDRNERVSPFPEWFMENIRREVTSTLLTWYPSQDQLHLQLQSELDLPEERLILTPSSDAAFKAIYQAYLRPSDSVVMLEPSYAMFPVYADMFEARSVKVTYGTNMELDTQVLLESIVTGVRLVMLANPNQPTGTVLSKEILSEVIEKAGSVGALVAVDEAYYPFYPWSALEWLEKYPNLLITRTFSKASGIAGVRIGFVAAHPDIITNLYKVRTVNDLNSFSIVCASEILKHPEVVADYVLEVQQGAKTLSDAVASFGLTMLPTHTNFALIKVKDRCQPQKLVSALKQQGYLVKGPLEAPCVADCIRVALGPPDLMLDFAVRLKDALGSDLCSCEEGSA